MKRKIDIKKYILIMIASVIIVFGIYLSNNIYNASFDQYIYSLLKSVGTSSSVVMEYAVTLFYAFILFSIFNLLFILPTMDFDKKIIIKNKKKGTQKQIFPIKNIKRYNKIVLVVSIIYLGIVVGFFDYMGNSLLETDLFKKYYIPPDDVEIEFPEVKKNLIYIFLESTEMTNVSKENGGVFDTSIMPNLENIALNNINFSNSNLLGGAQESYGTGWTVAAMIAQTAGIPLKLKMDDYESNSTNFNNITTLGDILNNNGYHSYLLLGSDSNFGGRKAYFSNHNYSISDYYSAIEEGKISKDYYEWWGYEDSKLFDYAKEKLEKISKDDEPFNLTILTANTHFTDGYLEDSCDNIFDNNYANSFYCSDQMIGEFIDWIEEQDFYENTTIIMAGDHPTMQNNFYDVNKDYTRCVYNAFINTEANDVNNKNRIFTTMDMFPTTLGALGVKIQGDRLGLGTNLFSNKETIPEEMGIDNFNKELKKNSTYYYKYIRG
ncbi:MAG: LTA synthase family protein [Bacilli bacterium]